MAQIGAAARGPLNLLLSNSGAQWATIVGLGAYVFNPDVCLHALRTITGDASLMRSNNNNNNSNGTDRTSPIIIHTGTDSRGGNGGASFLTTIVFYVFGAGCVWVSYTLVTTMLPSYIGDMMPVTRKVFEQTTKNLATSLFHVKEAMIKQIQFVMKKQDELAVKQDDTHRDVKDIQEDMKFVRADLSGVVAGVDRCEATVDASQRLQSYTARGVKLLVAAVATVLPRDDNHQILRELEKYARDGEQFRNVIERTQPHYQPPQSVEPPENEHPRQQQQQYSLPQRHATPMTHLDSHAELDFLAMIRDGTLVVQRS
jgi:hypothetical protein